jgi:hypothetical protein
MLRALDVMCECGHRAWRHSAQDFRACLARVGTCPCAEFRPVRPVRDPPRFSPECLDAALANFDASHTPHWR